MDSQYVASALPERNPDPSVAFMIEAIAQWTSQGDLEKTKVPGLSLFRREAPTAPFSGLYEPSLCLIVQGAKSVFLGGEMLTYNSRHYLITSVHLPTTVRITEASRESPCLGLKLTLDLSEISRMMADIHLPEPRIQKSCERGMATGIVTPELTSALARLVDLLGEEKDIPILAPLIHREVLYRLLVGEQGLRLRQIAISGSQSHQIAGAVAWMKCHFREPVKIQDLARQAEMSRSAFHAHFRAMTALSPLQFLKQLRLQEARRLMMSERFDAATASLHVGYESPSQFSREYRRMFGAPPLRDIEGIRQWAIGNVIG